MTSDLEADGRFTETFDGYALVGRYRHAASAASCGLLALHGARSDHRRLDPLLRPLQAAGVASLGCDLSGHGDGSPLPSAQTSLARNLQEALRFAQRLGAGPDTVFGHSLGGALAMKVAEHCGRTVRTLILSGPALYPEAAFSVPHYGPDFTRAISAPFGFMDSFSLPFLRRFAGRVILITGQHDGLPADQHGGVCGRSAGLVEVADGTGARRTVYSPIPAEVFEAIRDAAADRLSEVVLDGCDHKVLAHLADHPEVAHSLTQRLLQLMGRGPQAPGCRIATDGTVRAL